MFNCFFNKRKVPVPAKKEGLENLLKSALVAKNTVDNKLKPVSVIMFYYLNPIRAIQDMVTYYLAVFSVVSIGSSLSSFLLLVSEDNLIHNQCAALIKSDATFNNYVQNITEYKQCITMIIVGLLMLNGTLVMPSAAIHASKIKLSLKELDEINAGLEAIEQTPISSTHITRQKMNHYWLILGTGIENLERLINYKMSLNDTLSQALPSIPTAVTELISDYQMVKEDISTNSPSF